MLRSHLSQPLASEGCSDKLKNKFVLPALAGRAVLCSGLGARVRFCSVLPKIAPAASARETAPAASWLLANRKGGEEKKNPFWATLGSLRHRLWFSPQPHFPIFEKCLF